MIKRKLKNVLLNYKKFPVIGLLGPRQSGKTTLAKNTFPKYKFLTLDDDENRLFALEDPKGFLLTHENKHGIILDEFQYAPQLTTYVKILSDEKKRPGYFVLTGSQNFLVNKSITESLAGRIGILNLLPFSIEELLNAKLMPKTTDELIFNGGYPRIYAENFLPTELYPSYISSYIQRDVGQFINPENMTTFKRFVQLCAGRTGQLCNTNALAVESGVSAPTIKKWLSILESSYIIFFLEPHFNNFNKRLVKTPKLYFYDTGLAASLLRIESTNSLSNSHFRGSLFENLIISDLYKQHLNLGKRPSLYFWRDTSGANEVDAILDYGNKLIPIEIKAGQKIASDMFRGLNFWNKLSGNKPQDSYLIYNGQEKQTRKQGNIISLKDSATLVEKITKQ
jgi:uncharacterized protein